MSILDRVRASRNALNGVTPPLASVANGITGTASPIGQLARSLDVVNGKSLKNAVKVATGAVVRAQAAKAVNTALRAARISRLTPRKKVEPAKPQSPLPPNLWGNAPLWGGLTHDKHRQIFAESAKTPRAWKNMFHVSITEQRATSNAPAGPLQINLLAVDVSFAPVTMPGEAVPIGGAVMDRIAATERMELRMTTLDDDIGTLKRWFLDKSAQVAKPDGTFGLPADYLVTITVAHMDPLNESKSSFRHTWLMRPSNIEIELSRRAPELEELQMSFVQFDTFIPV